MLRSCVPVLLALQLLLGKDVSAQIAQQRRLFLPPVDAQPVVQRVTPQDIDQAWTNEEDLALPADEESDERDWSNSMALGNSVDKPEQTVASYRLLRDILQSRWSQQWHEDLPCSEAKYKGYVHKIGSGTQSPTLKLGKEDSEDIYTDEQLPIFVGCQVWISEKWGFIYIRQPKSSSTAVLTAIRADICGSEDPDRKCAKNEFRPAAPEDITDEIWEKMFVFTFVRNPWTRMLSAYNMFSNGFLRRKDYDGAEPGDHCGLPFEEYAEDANNMRQLCSNEECCVYLNNKKLWLQPFLDEHISDQSHCVFLPGGESMVDFIGTTESIDEDWPVVLAEINKRHSTNFKAAPVVNTNGHGSKSNHGQATACGLDSVRSMYNESTLYAMALQFSADVINFGYM